MSNLILSIDNFEKLVYKYAFKLLKVDMENNKNRSFPGGSRERINRAGNNVRNGVATQEDLEAIEEWRSAHRNVLNTFQAILRTRTKGKKIVVAQRHKRRNTIFDKLKRLPRLMLGRLDDVAGCRLIFDSIDSLSSFRENFHKARFKHVRKNDVDKYNYILKPKKDGYRGIHDVYGYNVNSKNGEKYSGLNVEIQYRTKIQHAWATAVEVIGLITKSQPKYQKGDNRYVEAMALASEILARAYENLTGPFPDLSNEEILENFERLDLELGLIRNLRGLKSVEQEVKNDKNVILIFTEKGELTINTFKDAPDALNALFTLENENPHLDIVLVKADHSNDIREAFKNYFSDARDFIRLIDAGCKILRVK